MAELELLKGYEHKLARESNLCLDLLTSQQDIIFVWSSIDKSVLAVNLKIKGNECNEKQVTLLTPSNDISFEVENLLLNDTCSYICLWAGNGLVIMRLPSSYDEKHVVCKADFIDQKLIIGDNIKVRAVKWHPGSSTDTHIVVLTDDETLRCHSITGEILWVCPFLKSRNKGIRHTLPDWSSLGMTAIDFDFIAPLEQNDPETAVWSILVLYGNGDVYLIETKMEKKKYSYQGPLLMYPPAHDNYGLDASSILVMKTSPPLIIISTGDNMIYHSMLMTDKVPDKKALFVFEAINLDIGMSLYDQDDILPSPIRLKHDPIDKSRYFCSHIGGLQLITVPFVASLAKFWEPDSANLQLSSEPSSIQNLLCTALIKGNQCESAPLLGFTFIDLFMSVLVLQSDGKIIDIKPFKTSWSLQGELTEGSTQTEDDFFQAVECKAKEARAMKPPLLKIPKNTSAQDCSILVSRASKTLSNCMKTHRDIALMLSHKSESIKDYINDEIQEIEDLKAKKSELQENAELIAVKYEELCDSQNSLVTRVDTILRQMHSAGATLSQTEIDTLKKLKTLQNNLKGVEEKVSKLKSSYEFQANTGDLKEVSFKNKVAFLNNVRIDVLRTSLSALTEEISKTSTSIEDQSKILNDLNII